MRICMLTILICALTFHPANPQSVTGKTWTVVMRFKDMAGEPDTRIYIYINADTEGQAAINANKFLYEKLQPGAYDKLQYVEAQQKK